MFVVAGVTGHTGKVVAETLLAQSLPVRVIVRDAKKGEAWKARGAEVALAEVKDVKAMTQALRGATGAYLLSPPAMEVTDLPKHATELAAALKAAITESGVKHVVFLSSIAAHVPSGTGPIVSVHIIEQAFKDLQAHVTFLRAGYFMENLLGSLHPMKEQGVLPAMFDAQRKLEMVATADIGAVAAELLRAGASAPKVVELSGPTPSTLTDAAKAFSAALKKPINLAPVPAVAQVDVLKGVGLPETWAKAYAEMNAAVEANRLVFEGTPRRGLITLEQFVARSVN
ncbi:MAG: NmrA family NAD(P)-binding protein [Archangium sp.]|nr:NmrA family NAD(P)-binding protein [Archangium sp.]MDP3153898.1 NmrA family NAD(P)-binding protein [Archangium sp.]MDP3575084.1 NmrA family NAD(P)-binding protein [Archangium sp.]